MDPDLERVFLDEPKEIEGGPPLKAFFRTCHIRLPLHIDRNDRRTFLRSLFSSLSRPRDRSRADASVHANERHALSRWDHQRLQTSP